MRGALSFARIIARLEDDDVARIIEDEAFDEIVLWLDRYRDAPEVATAVKRLLDAVRDRCH